MRSAFGVLLCLAGSAAAQTAAGPEPVFCVTPVQELRLVEGTLPSVTDAMRWDFDRPQPYAVLDGEGVAYVVPSHDTPGVDDLGQGRLAVRLEERRDVAGRLFLEGPARTLVAMRFELPAAAFSTAARADFQLAARDHYEALFRSGVAGAAWWRHRATLFAERAGAPAFADDGLRFPARDVATTMDDTLELFSGSRAIAENLQLDRTLPATPKDSAAPGRAVDTIAGITVAAYDWGAALAGAKPALDPLAALVPADQHAVFFPSFQALVDVSDTADAQGTPILQLLADRTGEAGAHDRCARQLGLPMSDLARMLGPKLIESVALTGGDPYLATGSDVAVLFQAKDAGVLQPLLVARVAASAPDTSERTGEVDGVAYVARVSDDRSVSSYVARLGDAVAVTNSPVQLARLVATRQGHAPSLASQPEYAFFRSRCPRGAAEESALLVLSDATIRRWCGPRCRIGDSRRTRAAAALSEVEARCVEAALAGEDPARGLASPPAGLGELSYGPIGARSSLYGTLAFMTPIAELDLTHVSEDEAGLYERWRDGYQRNWSGRFDPIAVRLGVAGPRLSADVTVRPLIVGSEYRDFVGLTGASKIAPRACDPHAEALLQWVIAIDRKAPLMSESTSMLSMMLPDVDALGWLGQSVSLYVDESPYWDELAAAEDSGDFLSHNWPRMPIALHAEVGNGLLLTGFLVGLRGLAEQSAPDMTIWENHTYRDEPYVSIRPSARALQEGEGLLGEGDGAEQAALYYSASGDGLVVSLDRALIERAIDRRLARRAASADAQPSDGGAAVAAPEWLGEHLGLRLRGEALGWLDALFSGSTGASRLRADSDANLPILNEWHRLFPGEDPLAVHERLWHRRLLCPGGGTYRWNEEWQTMESTVYGHPGQPRDGPSLPPALAGLASIDAGLTFEADGLRARFELQQTP